MTFSITLASMQLRSVTSLLFSSEVKLQLWHRVPTKLLRSCTSLRSKFSQICREWFISVRKMQHTDSTSNYKYAVPVPVLNATAHPVTVHYFFNAIKQGTEYWPPWQRPTHPLRIQYRIQELHMNVKQCAHTIKVNTPCQVWETWATMRTSNQEVKLYKGRAPHPQEGKLPNLQSGANTSWKGSYLPTTIKYWYKILVKVSAGLCWRQVLWNTLLELKRVPIMRS